MEVFNGKTWENMGKPSIKWEIHPRAGQNWSTDPPICWSLVVFFDQVWGSNHICSRTNHDCASVPRSQGIPRSKLSRFLPNPPLLRSRQGRRLRQIVRAESLRFCLGVTDMIHLICQETQTSGRLRQEKKSLSSRCYQQRMHVNRSTGLAGLAV